MSGLIRPELRAALWHWREALLGAAVALLAGWWALASFGVLRWLALVVALAALALAVQGVRRARFPHGEGGSGMVEVDERQITWFGPGGGAAVSIDTLVRVEFDTRGPRAWLFHGEGAAPLRIPADATGADLLFDALAPLPGLDFDAAIRAARGDAQGLFTIWQKDRARLH